LHEPGL